MKPTPLVLFILGSFVLCGHAANTILLGTDPIEETGSPDGWDGVVVMTTPIEGPPGETVGVLSTFNLNTNEITRPFVFLFIRIMLDILNIVKVLFIFGKYSV